MTPTVKLTLGIGICGAIAAYVIADLRFCGGPLSRALHPAGSTTCNAGTTADLVLATVGDYAIHRSQLERAVTERLWSEGRKFAELNPADRKLVRHAALDDLIDHELLRMKAKQNDLELVVSEAAIAERLRRFTARFASREELETAMKSQGIPSESALRERLAARIQQENYVESRIAPLVIVSDDEARTWYQENQQHLTIPERIEARHVFQPTLERDADEVKQALTTALAALTAKSKDFATLARELSDDQATKDHGGSLGWLTRDRLPADLAAPLFALPLNQPTLVRSKLGWHLVEVTARKPPEPRTFDQAKPEILTALEAVKRREATTGFRNKLRQFEAKSIVIHRELVDQE